MPQQQIKLNPQYLNLDTAYEKLLPNESVFIKNYGFDINANGQINTGTGNPSGEGQNEFTLTPTRSNVRIPSAITPIGFNKNIGTFESTVTRELYYFNANDKGNHGIYVISGDDYTWTQVIVDPKLNFSFEQENFIAEHRVRMRVRYGSDKNIIEKYLIWTDGFNWQGWVNVVAAIKTNGFNVQLFPYWATRQPHFDRSELLEYPVRPPMISPIAVAIKNTDADRGNPNWMLDTAFEFCYQFINTDGRETTTSSYSDPFIVKTEDFLSNPDLIPKKALLTLYAGSPLTEKIKLYVRFSKRQQDRVSEFQSYSIWYLYDTIYRFNDCGDNSFENIGNDYWLRTNQWSGLSYDPVQNTIKYIFDNSLLGQIVPQDLFSIVETAMPIRSVGLTDLGDSILLADNLYDYDNFPCSITDNITAIIKEKDDKTCLVPFRKVKLYAYAGQINQAIWASQVSYFNGADTQFRTGGLSINPATGDIALNVDESKLFELDFADKRAFQCYAKGTPYSSVGKLMVVNTDNTLVEVAKDLDASSDSDKEYIKSILISNSYFLWEFEFVIPSGVYDFAMGRHNVAASGDYRSTSTYVAGIANSRAKQQISDICTFVTPEAIVTYSKEIEVDCSNGDVDTWGNGHDLFYIVTPIVSGTGFKRFRFIEGYLRESRENNIPIELFPYSLSRPYIITGTFTDKNGHYFGYTRDAHSAITDVVFTVKLNCSYPHSFTQPTNQGGAGYRPNNLVYLTDYNNNEVGFGNYVVMNIKVTDITQTIGFSNIGVSIKDGATINTDSNGQAKLIIHNGQNTLRQSNIYVNASGNFIVTFTNCGLIPVSQYNEKNVVCQTEAERVYPFPITLQVLVQSNEQRSLKSNATYVLGVVGADLAGRRTYVNKIAQLTVDSFDQRNDVLATFVQWNKLGMLKLPPEISWFAFYITNYINYKSYLQWVGDKIDFIDASGNVTDNPSIASFVRININSLLTANINQNFTLIANYQFVIGDKLRVLDDGEGNLFDTATFGDTIDVDVQGSNYNQAAINANLINPNANTVLNPATATTDTATTVYVKYDSRWDKLKESVGFWIELYTPSENNKELPYFQTGSWIPVIQGELATFIGYDSNGNPRYNFPTQGNLSYWDTYFLQRSIAVTGSGNRNFNHPFESPNITDTWGVNITSAGQPNELNPDAKQTWFSDCVIKSDNYISEGLKNGLATFRDENKKCFTGYWWGGIVAVKAINSIVFFLCENDYFTTDYNFHYTYPNSQGVMVVNLDNGLSQPHQKIDYTYGCNYDDTGSVIIDDRIICWHDQKNSCYLVSNLQTAEDITQEIIDGRKVGIKSYYSAKANFIGKWNLTHTTEERFDIIAGLDMQLNNLHITFRPRRKNSEDALSCISNQRNVRLNFQETFVYSLDLKKWIRTTGFTPEAYGKLRGALGNEMFSFAQGIPYYHLNTPTDSYCNFFGIDTERVIMIVVNDSVEMEKILQSTSLDSNNTEMFVDLLYSDVINSFSYIPVNYFKRKGRFLYAPILRNANTYANGDNFRSMIVDGNSVRGTYFIVRFVGDLNNMQQYQELNQIFFKYIPVLETVQK